MQLAKRLDTTQSVISRIENAGTTKISLEYLLKILAVLGDSPADTMRAIA